MVLTIIRFQRFLIFSRNLFLNTKVSQNTLKRERSNRFAEAPSSLLHNESSFQTCFWHAALASSIESDLKPKWKKNYQKSLYRKIARIASGPCVILYIFLIEIEASSWVEWKRRFDSLYIHRIPFLMLRIQYLIIHTVFIHTLSSWKRFDLGSHIGL